MLDSSIYLYYDLSLFAETKPLKGIQRQAFAATILWQLHHILEKMLN